MKCAGRRVTVVGAARSGVAAANVLVARGASVTLVDREAGRPRPPRLSGGVQFWSGTDDVPAADLVVLSPGVTEQSPVRALARTRAPEVIGEVELFWRLCPSEPFVVAVTGTDGKSTVTTMLGAVWARAERGHWVGGNLGTPLCELLDAGAPPPYVLAEISAFQLTTCALFRPRVAVVTNIADDHLDYHGTFERYQAAKRRVWAAMRAGDVLVLNADDPHIALWSLPTNVTVRRFSLRDPSADGYVDGEWLWIRRAGAVERWIHRARLPLRGVHNVANALAAGLAASAAGIDLGLVADALGAYRALPHRIETVAVVDEVEWVDDSKATNPHASSAALRAFSRPVVLLAGGAHKGAALAQWSALVREKCRGVVVFGRDRAALRNALSGATQVEAVETLAEAVEVAASLARPGDVALLSPACASLDAYRSYAERGADFASLVRDRDRARAR